MEINSNGKQIFHICHKEEWIRAIQFGTYNGSSQDQADGFIHFSTGSQIKESAKKHRAGQDQLLLLRVNSNNVYPGSLKWETSRRGELFPHVYGALSIDCVIGVDSLTLGHDGHHRFPVDIMGMSEDEE